MTLETVNERTLPRSLAAAVHTDVATHQTLRGRQGHGWWTALTGRLAGTRGVLAMVLALLVVQVLMLLAPPLVKLNDFEDATTYLLTLWEVGAAVGSIALAILFLIVQTTQPRAGVGFLWASFGRSVSLYVTFALVVGVILSGGIGPLLQALWATSSVPAAPGLTNLVFFDTGLFVAASLSLIWMYREVFRFLHPGWTQEAALGFIRREFHEAVGRSCLENIERSWLIHECERLGLGFSPRSSDRQGLEPIVIPGTGRVVDVNLVELLWLAATLRTEREPRTVVAITIGQAVPEGGATAMLVHPEDATDAVVARVRRCFRVKQGRDGSDAELVEVFSFLSEQASTAITARRSEELRHALDALLEAIRVALVGHLA